MCKYIKEFSVFKEINGGNPVGVTKTPSETLQMGFFKTMDEMTFRPMRRFKQQLPEEECIDILQKAYRGFLSGKSVREK